jgi:hypothetical protein
MKKTSLVISFILLNVTLFAQNIPFTKDIYQQWLDMRVGTGKPIYWYCFGEIYTYPDGKLVGRMEGFDTARLIKINADSSLQLNRKIFYYEDAKTGEIIDEANGKKVNHIKYPYQFISYIRKNDKLITWVEQGAGAAINKMGPGEGIIARKMGQNISFAAPVFLNFETPRGKYEAYENYDFVLNHSEKDGQKRNQLFWVRYGDMAPFFGTGKAIIQLASYRVDSFDALPEKLKKRVREQDTMWLEPPKSVEEIRELQKK